MILSPIFLISFAHSQLNIVSCVGAYVIHGLIWYITLGRANRATLTKHNFTITLDVTMLPLCFSQLVAYFIGR